MQTFISKSSSRFSLSIRVSVLLMLAALLPLIITIVSSELLSRPQLTAQANSAMEADARTHIQSIENFFSQPVIDVSLISQNAALSNFLSGDLTRTTRQAAIQVLATGFQRNISYISWSLIDTHGTRSLLSYPSESARRHGNYFIPPATLLQLTIPNKAIISSAFYNPAGNQLTSDVSEPIFANDGQILGFLRVTLNINFIWDMVQSELGQNGSGSYAFITDENGVIIAHSDIMQNFTAIMPFTSSAINDIQTLDRYGKNIIPTILNYNSLPAAQKVLNSRQQQVTLQMVPPGQQNSFQVIGKPVSIVPWNYYVLSPTNVVTALANQQLLTIGFIALVVLLLAAATGLIVGHRITSPVLRSVKKLQSSSHLLQELAAKEQVTITEQVWIVDSSQTGLSSVNYYLEATQQAARRMLKVGADMEQHWHDMDQAKVREALKKIMTAAQYIESAAHYQKASSQKLSATIDLTKQVTDQLSLSADSATNAAQQMEQVVSDLQQVVGKN